MSPAPESRTRRRRDERGYAAILVAAFAASLLAPLCAISVDVSRWYVEVQRVQNAADAAATAGVTFLPDDFGATSRVELVRDIGHHEAELGSVVPVLRVQAIGAIDTSIIDVVAER